MPKLAPVRGVAGHGLQGPGAFLLLLAALAAAGAGSRGSDFTHVIQLHVGIPGVVYIGQPLRELIEKFPKAKVSSFAGQDDAFNVSLPEEGISCIAVGPKPEELTIASAGFNLDQTYEGVREGPFRTREGIAKGSTVNDLLAAYGKPTSIHREGPANPALRLSAPKKDDPNVPMKYTYRSPDGKVSTYFVVQTGSIVRVAVNALEPINRHLMKSRPGN